MLHLHASGQGWGFWLLTYLDHPLLNHLPPIRRPWMSSVCRGGWEQCGNGCTESPPALEPRGEICGLTDPRSLHKEDLPWPSKTRQLHKLGRIKEQEGTNFQDAHTNVHYNIVHSNSLSMIKSAEAKPGTASHSAFPNLEELPL